MFKAVVFDIDAMVLTGSRFSDCYAKEFGVPLEAIAPFFKEPFDRCVLGKSDLKAELESGGWLLKWQWKGSADELLTYWFNCGNNIDRRILDSAAELRARGVVCILATNQEKYRAAYLRGALRLEKHFDAMFVSCEAGFKKTSPEFLDKVMEFVNAKAPTERAEVIFWDDIEVHVAGAKAFGIDALFYSGFEQYQKLNG